MNEFQIFSNPFYDREEIISDKQSNYGINDCADNVSDFSFSGGLGLLFDDDKSEVCNYSDENVETCSLSCKHI